jgi:DNA-binding response OmpR family regulator
MKKILLVDDDEDILDIIESILKLNGFDVQTHSSNVDVSEIVKWNYPNLILLDIRFFGKLGTEICKELKQTYDIPVILISADTKRGNEFELCKADAFIQKPFKIKHLVDTINLYVN